MANSLVYKVTFMDNRSNNITCSIAQIDPQYVMFYRGEGTAKYSTLVASYPSHFVKSVELVEGVK